MLITDMEALAVYAIYNTCTIKYEKFMTMGKRQKHTLAFGV